MFAFPLMLPGTAMDEDEFEPYGEVIMRQYGVIRPSKRIKADEKTTEAPNADGQTTEADEQTPKADEQTTEADGAPKADEQTTEADEKTTEAPKADEKTTEADEAPDGLYASPTLKFKASKIRFWKEKG